MAEDKQDSIVSESSESGKKKGLPLVPIIIVLVLLVGGGAVGWFVVMPMLSPPVDAEAAAEEVAQDAPAGPGIYDPEHKPGILEFDQPFTIKLKKKEGVLQGETYLKFAISLEVVDEEVQAAMKDDPVVMARIKDKINTYFSSQYPSNVAVSNWVQLKENLQALINEEFPANYHIVRVNFHDFLLQTGR